MKLLIALAALGLVCIEALDNSPKSHMLRASEAGCFQVTLQDAVGAESASDIHMNSGMTAFLCLSHCNAYGYEFSGVVNGKKCECAHEISDDLYIDTDASDCSPCAGQTEGMCGGMDVISIYSTTLLDSLSRGPAGSLYQGCFPRSDALNLDEDISADELDDDQLYGPKLTAEACVSYCRFSNKRYSFITESDRCFCSTIPAISLGVDAVDDSYCDEECHNQPGSSCGGDEHVSQYEAPAVEYDVEVTGEGATRPGTLEADNHRQSYFKVDGVYNAFTSVGEREMGINILTFARTNPGVTKQAENFDEGRNPGDRDALEAFLENDIDQDDVVLFSVRGDASQTCKERCLRLLRRLGSFNVPEEYGSWAFVGYKGNQCGQSIAWLEERTADHDAARASEAMMVTVSTKVPLVCFEAETLQDRNVKVVSEGGFEPENFEYGALNILTQQLENALFYVNGQRIVSSSWERGINVVSFPRSSARFRPAVRDFRAGQVNAGDEFAAFITGLEDDTVVLVSVWGDAEELCNPKCKEALQKIGGRLNFGEEDSYALIGYKGTGCKDGYTDRQPFVQEALAERPGPESNVQKEATPVEVYSTIPRECYD